MANVGQARGRLAHVQFALSMLEKVRRTRMRIFFLGSWKIVWQNEWFSEKWWMLRCIYLFSIYKREGGRLGVEKMKVNSVLNRNWTLDPIWLKNSFWYLSEIFLLLLFSCVFTTFFFGCNKKSPPPGLTEKTRGRHHPSGSRRDVAPARVRHGASPNTSPPSRQRWHRRGGGWRVTGWRVTSGSSGFGGP